MLMCCTGVTTKTAMKARGTNRPTFLILKLCKPMIYPADQMIGEGDEQDEDEDEEE
jgi:hypothetical protein